MNSGRKVGTFLTVSYGGYPLFFSLSLCKIMPAGVELGTPFPADKG